MNLEIQYKNINDLIPYARNSRTHNDAQVAQIAASIKEFGWTNPVLMDGDNGIIAGHGRVLAARKLGHKEIPTIELSHMTDIQKQAYVIADNKLALNAGWDEEILGLEIQDLKDAGFDIELLGFDADELKDTISGYLDELSENYSRKIEAPIYTPKGEKPISASLYDETKTTELKLEISKANLPVDIEKFLVAAAERHTVFDFRNIAEFYAHADAVTQELMERSALIIIDYDKAVENGFVHLSEAMMEQTGKFKSKSEQTNAK